MTTEILEPEVEVLSNELVKVVETSGVEKTKSQKLLEMFTPYFNKMGEIEHKIKVLNAENPGKEDVKIAREIRLALKNNRVAAEKIKDDSKAAILIEGRLIDNLNNIVKNTSKGLELQCEQIEKDAEIKEAARVEAIRLERAGLLSAYVEDANIFPLGTMTDEQFSTMLSGYKLAHQQKIEAEQKADAERLEKEAAEKLEQERIRLENEKLKAEAAEREKQLEAERVEAKRKADELEAENKKKLAAIEESNRIAREKAAAEQAERDRLAKVEAGRLKAEADKLAAELKAKQDAEKAAADKLEAERKSKLAAEKKAAKAPDKDKLKAAIELLPGLLVEVKTEEAQIVADNIREKFIAFKRWANEQIATL